MTYLQTEIEIAAEADAIWEAWTTDAGVRSFFAPDSRVSAEPDGPYELYFLPDAPVGARGSEGCVVVDAERPERLVFTWSFPPSLPAIRAERTQVEVSIEAQAEGGCLVTVLQTGWGDGPDWDAGFAYFERAWAIVLGRLAYRFLIGPLDWEDPYDPLEEDEPD
jgi:uncharacterized protein YndB with AHSA1/START domain